MCVYPVTSVPVINSLLRSGFRKLGLDVHRHHPGVGGNTADSDFSDADRALIKRVKPFTMTTPERIVGLRAAVQYVCANRLPGDFVECGVWRGGSTMAAALTFMEMGDTSRDLWLFDTFEGMPPPKDMDVRYDGVSAQALLGTHAKTTDDHYWAIAPLNEVHANLTATGYPSEKWHCIKGRVEETIPAQAPADIALLRLDTDWYESTKHELDHLYRRVTPGGVVIIDDYGWYRGARQATDEFLAALPFKPLLNRLDRTGRLLIKPA
jgi:O-methyltransferase